MSIWTIILIVLFIGVIILGIIATAHHYKKPISGGQDISHYASILPENTIMTKLKNEPPLGFDTIEPVVYDFKGNNEHVVFIDLVDGTGQEYVRKVGKDNLQLVYNNLFVKPFYEKWLIGKKKKEEEVMFFIKKLNLPAAAPYKETIVTFYKEMCAELSGLPIEPTDITEIDSWNPEFKKWFEFVILLDVQLETYVWMYLHMINDLNIPKSWVDAFGTMGKNCSFMNAKAPYTTGDALIARNLDWMTPVYDNIPLHVFHHTKHGVITMGFPGMVFCTLTAINKHNVWCSFNNLSYSLGTALSQNYPSVVTDMFFKVKEAKNASQLNDFMNAINYDINIFYFAGDQTGVYCSAQKVMKDKNFKVTEGTPENKIFARANKVLNPLWYANKLADPTGWGSDSVHRQTVMMKQMIDNKGKLDDKLFMHIFQEPLHTKDLIPGDNSKDAEPYGKGPTLYVHRGHNSDHTVYQCVFNCNTHMLYLRGNCILRPNFPWYKLDVNKIFDGTFKLSI
jgi:hypothetical protein